MRIAATVSLGEPRTLQAPDSAVSLSIPEGAPGVYTTQVDTSIPRIKTLVPDTDQIISPLVYVEFSPLQTKEQYPPRNACTLCLPQCLRDPRLWQDANVWHYPSTAIGTQTPTRLQWVPNSEVQQENHTFTVNEHGIIITARHFSPFVASCCRTKCEPMVNLLVIGKMDLCADRSTRVDIKAFLTCPLYNIDDFESVSHSGKYRGEPT